MNKRWGQLVNLAQERWDGFRAHLYERRQQYAAVWLAVFAVLAVAFFAGRTDPAEILWTALGAGGSVYAGQVFHRRWLVDRWRRQHHINGLFQITCQQHLVLRGLGFAMQILILLGGLGAMLNAPRLLILAAVIGVAVLATVGAWYAEKKAEQQAAYIRRHPEAS